MPPPRPSQQELDAAAGCSIPDVLAPGLEVLFCGINPGLYSGATGYHFARPGNRFWPALRDSGFTPRQLDPSEQAELLDHRLGITNLVTRASASAGELAATELRAGADRLEVTVRDYRPRWLAVLGVTAYRTGFDERHAQVGHQPHGIDGTGVWLLPNPSGLNARWPRHRLAEEFARLREYCGG